MFEQLDAVIGLVVYFSIISMLASVLQEMLSAWFRSRGEVLRQAVGQFCLGDEALRKRIYDHPLIASLRSRNEPCPARWKALRRLISMPPLAWLLTRRMREWLRRDADEELPAYIEPATFARAFSETLLKEPLERAGDLRVRLAAAPIPAGAQAASATPNIFALTATLAMRAGGDPEKFQRMVEDQFNQVGARAAGWFRRATARQLFWIGLLIAVVTNGDCLALLNRLMQDPKLRAAMVDRGQRILDAQDALLAASGGTPPSSPAASRGGLPEGLQPLENSLFSLPVNSNNLSRAEDFQPVRSHAAEEDASYDLKLNREIRTFPDGTPLPARRMAELAATRAPATTGDLLALYGEVQGYTGDLFGEFEKEWRAGLASYDQDGVSVPTPSSKFVAFLWFLVGKIPGFLLTALAVSLGAPFWFDTLKRVMSIRTSFLPSQPTKAKPDPSTPAGAPAPAPVPPPLVGPSSAQPDGGRPS